MHHIVYKSIGLFLLIISASCTHTEQDALNKETAWTQKIPQNYLKLGKCMVTKLNSSQKVGTQETVTYTNGIPIHDRRTTNIYGKEDLTNKNFYNLQEIKAGLHTFRHWSIVIQNLNPAETESLFMLKGTTLWGSSFLDHDELQRHISQCVKGHVY